jgi:hypothetical protein
MVLDDRLELFDPRFHHPLLVLGRVVLEVLGEVTELPGGLDLGHDRGALDGGQLVELVPDGLEPFGGDVNVVGHDSESKRRAS